MTSRTVYSLQLRDFDMAELEDIVFLTLFRKEGGSARAGCFE